MGGSVLCKDQKCRRLLFGLQVMSDSATPWTVAHQVSLGRRWGTEKYARRTMGLDHMGLKTGLQINLGIQMWSNSEGEGGKTLGQHGEHIFVC